MSQYSHELLCDLFRLDAKFLKQGRLIIVIYWPISATVLALIGGWSGLRAYWCHFSAIIRRVAMISYELVRWSFAHLCVMLREANILELHAAVLGIVIVTTCKEM